MVPGCGSPCRPTPPTHRARADDDDSGDELSGLSSWLDKLVSPEKMVVYRAQDEFEPFTVTLPGRLLANLLELRARYTDEIAREDAGELVEETCQRSKLLCGLLELKQVVTLRLRSIPVGRP